ncbi:hypothetical protein D3C81_1944170 [compost metagenome]
MPSGRLTGPLTVGASLVLATLRVKRTSAVAPPSLTRTRTSIAPTSPFAGVPLKVRVAGSNVSQAGNGSPLARVAL